LLKKDRITGCLLRDAFYLLLVFMAILAPNQQQVSSLSNTLIAKKLLAPQQARLPAARQKSRLAEEPENLPAAQRTKTRGSNRRDPRTDRTTSKCDNSLRRQP
jgi:hypothetical protein